MKLVQGIAAIIDIALLAWLVSNEGIGRPGVFLAWCLCTVAAGILVARNWPFGPLTVLVVASAMPRATISTLHLHLRPEHIAIALVLVSTLIGSHRRWCYSNLKWHWFDYALLMYVATSFLTSATSSPSPTLTLRWATMGAVSITAYFLIRLLVRDERSLQQGVNCLLWVGAIESLVGIACFLSNRVFATQFGVAAEQYGFMPGTHGTQYEANLFGAYAACCAILFLVIYLRSDIGGRGWYLGGLIVATAATLVSLSRAAMLALFAVSGLILWLTLRRRQLNVRRTIAFAIAVGFLFAVASPFILNFVEERFASIDLTELASDETTQIRLVQIAAACDEIREHPIWGMGTNSFQLTFDWQDYVPGGVGADEDASAWIGNTVVRVLHDTGVIGLAFFLAFLALLAITTRRALKSTSGSKHTLIFALCVSLVVYIITFQMTEASILAFPWIHIGMLTGAITSTGTL